jgi:hypothetical protein
MWEGRKSGKVYRALGVLIHILGRVLGWHEGIPLEIASDVILSQL